jgi:hypothetical protein
MCKEILSYLPKVVGIDIVELALWAKVHIKLCFLLQRPVYDLPLYPPPSPFKLTIVFSVQTEAL